MFGGVGKKYYNIKEILSNVNQEQLFLHYLGILPNASGRFYSPFRTDKNPGCRFRWYSGILYLVENTMYKNKLYWSIFDCLQERYGMTFLQAVETIVNDYKLDNTNTNLTTVSKTKKPRPTIRFTSKPFERDNLFYLSNETLNKEYVFLVEDYWISTNNTVRKNPIHNPRNTTTIAYYFPDSDHVKLYFPNETEMRWYSNCDTNDIFGKYKINYYSFKYDYLVITKSQKDRLILDYKFNIPSIAVQNEGCFIPKNIIDEIRELFPEIYILFDNDETGEKMSQKLIKEYDFKNLKLPTVHKDTYELFQKMFKNNENKIN
jgi:hypothetical protein